MSWEWWTIIGIVVVLVGHRYVPPHWWYLSPAKRRAMSLAMRATRERYKTEIVFQGCFIRRRDQQKCFVFVEREAIGRPEPYAVFAVWFENDQVDDLGSWVFHWGMFFPAQPMDAYEECRAAGDAWPVGLTQWMGWAKERGKPVP